MKKLLTLFLITMLALTGDVWAQRISSYTDDPSPTSDDLLVTVDDPSTNPVNKKVTLGNLYGATKTLTNTTYNTAGTGNVFTINGTAVTTGIPVSVGGTGLTGALDDNLMVGNGTTWQSKALVDCDDEDGNHLNYDASTNTFSCGTSTNSDGTFDTLTVEGVTTVSELNVQGPLTYVGGHQTIGFKNTSVTENSFEIDGNDGDDGVLRFMSVNNTNNGIMDIDLEGTAGAVVFEFPTSTNPSKAFTAITKTVFDSHLQSTSGNFGGASHGVSWTITDDVVSSYNLDDNAANTTVADGVGSNTGTAFANTSTITTTGKLGTGSITFVGSSNQFINLGSDASLKFADDFSVSLWVNPGSSSTARYIIGNRSAAGNNAGWEIFTDAAGTFPRINLDDDGATTISLSASSNIETSGTWHHLVMVVEGASLKLYVNGVSEGTQNIDITGDYSTNAGNMYIGSSPMRASGGISFTGEIDQVVFVGRAITATEVAFLYNSGTGTISTSGSIGSTAGMGAIVATTTWNSTQGLGDDESQTGDLGIGGKLEVDGIIYADAGIIPRHVTADPCSSGQPEGLIFWNTTANEHCACDGTNDVRIKDYTTACF